MPILAEGLLSNDSVRFLNLSHNKITHVGAKSIKTLLEASKALRVLFLHWNELGADGGA